MARLRALVRPPLPESLRGNLVSAVGTVEVPTERWRGQGITYRPHRYVAGAAYAVDPDCGPHTTPTVAPPALVEWDDVVLTWEETCAAFTPADLADLRERVRQDFEAQFSHKLEGVLWTNKVGGVDLATSHPNVGLASTGVSTLVFGDPVGVMTAWRGLLRRMSTCLGGARGVIHVPQWSTGYLDYYGLIIKEGTRLVGTSSDHIVVAGTGYTGAGPGDVAPAAGNAWFYATSMVEVRRGAVEVPALDPENVDRVDNSVAVYGTAPALASWDRACHLAVEVCLEDPGPLCAEGS